MSDASTIEWTDATWNVVTGCTKVSPGCDHCYAETFAERWRGTPGHHFENGFDLTLRPERLELPLKWKKPRRIFVNSMSDLFHSGVPEDFIAKVWTVMEATPQHTYQILTKRHARLRSVVRRIAWRLPTTEERRAGQHGHRAYVQASELLNEHLGPPRVLPNVWLGVSVEDQQRADLRIPALLETPAAVRFISAEPLLGPVDLSQWMGALNCGCGSEPGGPFTGCSAGCMELAPGGLDWVIVGGESGHGARPMHPGWARTLRDQCTGAGVPFFFKQFGEWAPTGRVGIGRSDPRELLVGKPDERGFREEIRRVGKKAGGRELDGRTWDEYPDALRTAQSLSIDHVRTGGTR